MGVTLPDRSGLLSRAIVFRTAPVRVTINGEPVDAYSGQSVLATMLTHTGYLRRLEFNNERRAGFCLMGACQDCWVWTGDAGKVRACTTLVTEGMAIFTDQSPEYQLHV